MADRARSTFPIAVEFVDGELPSAIKMNGLSRQAKQSSNLIEFMLGDVWNQSGDNLLQSIGISENALMISNIARYLGASKNINPRIPYLPNIEKYTHKATISEIGEHELLLEFSVKSGSSYVWTGTGAPSGSPEISRSDVISSNQWYVDEDTGQVYTYDAVVSDWDLTYEPVIDGDIGSLTTWNVIPDPDTDVSYSFQGVKIQYVNLTDNQQGYLIFLPPRGPLNSRRIQKSPQKDTVSPNNTKNFQTLPATGDMLFWQDDTVDAVDTSIEGEHYRYNLPRIITNSPSWGKSVAIPQGLVYLWDPINTGTIIEGVILSAENATVPRKYVFVAQGGNLDTWISSYGSSSYPVSALQNSSQSASFYPTNGLRVITIGSSLSDTISSLLSQYLNHDHSSSNSLSIKPVIHNKLKNLFDVSGEGTSFSSFHAPTLINDDHPQYLHRYGSTSGTSAENRDKYKNSMLGDLLIGSTDSSSNHINISNDSYRLRFNTLNNVSIFYDQSSDSLRMDHPSNLSPRFEFAKEGESTSRYLIEPSNLGTRLRTLQSNHFISLQPLGDLYLDSGNNGEINIGTVFGPNNIKIGWFATSFTENITAECTEQFIIRAGVSANLPIEQPNGNGIRLYSENRLDIAAGINAPTIGSTNNDIFLRAEDDLNIKVGDDVNIEANDTILITADSDSSGVGNILLQGRSIKATLTSPITENIVVPFIGGVDQDADGSYFFPPAIPVWRVIDGQTLGFTLTLWPHGMTLNNLAIDVINNEARNITIEVYRHSFGSGLGLMGSSITAVAASGSHQVVSVTTSSLNVNLLRNLHTITGLITAGPSGFGGIGVSVYPGIRINITYSKLWPWPAQT